MLYVGGMACSMYVDRMRCTSSKIKKNITKGGENDNTQEGVLWYKKKCAISMIYMYVCICLCGVRINQEKDAN